jgi:phage terminase large subunit-like protein
MSEANNITIESALTDQHLLGSALGDVTTWSTWLAVLKASFGLHLNKRERVLFASVAGNRKPPTKRLSELWALAGRGSGKSRVSAAICVYLAVFQKHDLDPGETGYVLALAGSRDQAHMVYNYARLPEALAGPAPDD